MIVVEDITIRRLTIDYSMEDHGIDDIHAEIERKFPYRFYRVVSSGPKTLEPGRVDPVLHRVVVEIT